MVLVEILANSWGTYRMGVTNAVQHADFDSAILFLLCMHSLLPKNSKPVLTPVPVASDIKGDIALKGRKWSWLITSMPLVEEAVSKWVHANMTRI